MKTGFHSPQKLLVKRPRNKNAKFELPPRGISCERVSHSDEIQLSTAGVNVPYTERTVQDTLFASDASENAPFEK